MKRSSVRALLATAAVCVLCGLGVAWGGGCAESKLNKAIGADQAAATAGDASAAAATAKKTALDAAVAAAKTAATGADGTVDLAKEYAGLVARVQAMEDSAAAAADAAAIAAKVATGSTPEQAGAALAAQAAADAKKYADQAQAARDDAAALQSQVAAAKAKDTATWTTGIQSLSSVADLFWPGVGAIAGGVGLALVNKLRGNTFADGQTDGAVQVTQSVSTARKLSPTLDAAFAALGPLVKNAIAGTMDDHVAAAVAANVDVPADGTHALLPTPAPVIPPGAATA